MVEENKNKIAIWGINEVIIGAIRNEINPYKASIECFIDSNLERQQEVYMGKKVLSPEVFDYKSVDYIIVAALSAYEKIKTSLIGKNVPSEKIHPFITPQLTQYCVGPLDEGVISLIKEIYFESEYLIENVQKYIEIYEEYSAMEPFEEEATDWFPKSELISHACGGFVNGKQCMYSNSKEALEYSFDEGFPLIECDILGMEFGEPILAHDYANLYEAREKGYTILTVRDALAEIQKHPEVSLLIDVKWRKSEEYARYVSYIDETIQKLELTDVEKIRLKKQIVMEVYNEETIIEAYNRDFQMFFTQYRNDEKSLMKVASLCNKYGIKVLGISITWFEEKNSIAKFIPIVKDKNIKIYSFSTDSIKDFQYLKSVGVDGIFTNYLVLNDIKGM